MTHIFVYLVIASGVPGDYETARQLRQEADLLDLTRVHAVWVNDPHVAEALREYQHPSTRLDETEIMEGMEF